MTQELKEYRDYLEEKQVFAKSPLLERARQEGWEEFSKSGLPNKKVEDFRYTQLAPYFQKSCPAISKKEEVQNLTSVLEKYGEKDAIKFVFYDGLYLGSVGKADKALTIKELSEALEKDNQFRDVFAKKMSFPCNSLCHINKSFSSEGLVFSLEKNAEVKKPIEIFYIGEENKRTNYTQSFFLSQGNSSLKIKEYFLSSSEDIEQNNCLTTILLGENDQWSHTRFVIGEDKGLHFSQVNGKVPRNSHLKTYLIQLSGSLLRNQVEIFLTGEGAETTVNGVYTGSGQQQSDHYTTITHQASHSYAHQLYKGLLTGKAKGVFKGTIVVEEGLKGIDSNQQNRNLLLSKGAHCDSMPQLEILSDDVKCAHGSTTGQINFDELFYLLTRGIDPQLAQQMLYSSFVGEVLESLSEESLKKEAEKYVLEKLTGLQTGDSE